LYFQVFDIPIHREGVPRGIKRDSKRSPRESGALPLALPLWLRLLERGGCEVFMSPWHVAVRDLSRVVYISLLYPRQLSPNAKENLMTNTPTANTIQVHRVFASTPEKIWRAFTQPDAFVRWLPPNGFTGHVHEMDVKVGGKYRMSFTNFTTDDSHFFGGKYIELRPNECIAYTAQFENPHLPGEMTTRVIITPVSVGVEIQVTQSGIPAPIPVAACCLGWQESLLHLANLVVPNIPG
jgi:uncharacterized protein YndB with AHSA1/START domain